MMPLFPSLATCGSVSSRRVHSSDWAGLHFPLYFIESYPVLYNNYGNENCRLWKNYHGNTMDPAKHRGMQKAGFYASYNINPFLRLHKGTHYIYLYIYIIS